MLKKFEFKVSHSFKIREGKFFALVGIMEPDTTPIVTRKYHTKLITKSGKEHVFTVLGEEIFVASPGKIIGSMKNTVGNRILISHIKSKLYL